MFTPDELRLLALSDAAEAGTDRKRIRKSTGKRTGRPITRHERWAVNKRKRDLARYYAKKLQATQAN